MPDIFGVSPSVAALAVARMVAAPGTRVATGQLASGSGLVGVTRIFELVDV